MRQPIWNTSRDQRGFTLIELAVVMIIIAIMAAIAYPVFLKQREKAWVAQSESALRTGKIAAESYYVGDGDGSYSGLSDVVLEAEGSRVGDSVVLVAGGQTNRYCIVAIHLDLPASHEWQVASLDSTDGTNSSDDTCSWVP